ncbi:MAG: Glyoxalase-like domain protein [Mucilaginibacter sp.]|nr:Glyoxalase-like domain protein [Mucilaginibacter sp.]
MTRKSIVLSLLLSFIFFATAISTFAQGGPIANHTALYVKDLKKSADFYKNVMLLKEIPEPFHDNKHVWLRTGEHSQLHLIQGATEITEHDINSHFAYSVKNLQDFTKHLDQLQYKYGNWKGDSKSPQLRPDGVKQVYLQDPDNIWIEVNDDKY